MLLDGTPSSIHRCAFALAGQAGVNQDPYYSHKHHRPGVTVQT
jgi:hypothetical protein